MKAMHNLKPNNSESDYINICEKHYNNKINYMKAILNYDF